MVTYVVLTDETAIVLAIYKQNLVKKLTILHDCYSEYGMKINIRKINFFVVDSERGDTKPIFLKGLTVRWCHSHVYLASPFTCDGNVSHYVKLHVSAKLLHSLKFASFNNKNNDVPLVIKTTDI